MHVIVQTIYTGNQAASQSKGDDFLSKSYFGRAKYSMGSEPRMMWATLSCSSMWTKISALSIFVRSGSLTRLRFGIVEYLSANSPKIKILLEYNTDKIRTNLQVKIEEVSTKNVRRKGAIVRVINLNLNTPPGVPSRVGK